MDYYESVVINYLRADRAVFVNTEYCIQLNPGPNPDTSGPHWYCDAVALDFRSKQIFLCEISYAARLAGLTERLSGWQRDWDRVCDALARDSFFSERWPIRPWLFVPEKRIAFLKKRLGQIANGQPPKFDPRITPLEMVQPWRYSSWSRKDDCSNEAAIAEIPGATPD
jgi:hypothetical protein